MIIISVGQCEKTAPLSEQYLVVGIVVGKVNQEVSIRSQPDPAPGT